MTPEPTRSGQAGLERSMLHRKTLTRAEPGGEGQ